ncbi:MAG: archease [Candidatus Micrarchaeota archaeon]
MPYKFLEHTADVLVEASGANYERALEEAAHALFSIMAERVKEERELPVEARAASLDDLVVFTLSEILGNTEIEEMLPARFKILELKKEGAEFIIRGIVFGGSGKQSTVVKAITFHELRVEQTENETKIRVLFDV